MKLIYKMFLLVCAFVFIFIIIGSYTSPRVALASTGFTITTPTSAIGAATPSRAITLTVTGGAVGGSDASFALSDNGAGGTFYPSSPVTIAANSIVGSTTQFVYIPTPTATGVISITATATGGITAAQTLNLPIGVASKFAYDTFSGSSGTNILNHTPDIGAEWVNPGNPCGQSGQINIYLNGSNGVYNSGTGHLCGTWDIPTSATSNEQDVATTFSNINLTTSIEEVAAFNSNADATLNGYRLFLSSTGYGLAKYIANVGRTYFTNYGSAMNGSTHTLKISIRNINGLQYIFPMVDGVLLNAPVQDSSLTSGYPGFIDEIPTGETPASTDSVANNFTASNVDWTPISPATSYTVTGPSSGTVNQASTNFTVTPLGLYSGTITPSDGGAGGTFTPSSLTFSNSGVAQTFTYTPATTGSLTISTTSSPGLTNSTPISFTSSLAPLVVTFPNSNIYESPDVWRSSGSSIISPTGGSYLKFNVTGTQNITANVDTTLNASLAAGDMPSIKVIINGGTPYFVQFPANNTSNTSVSIATGLNSSSTYSVALYMIGGNGDSGNGWTGTSFQTKINSLQFDNGATLSAPTLDSNTCLFFGDSYLASYFGGPATSIYYQYVDFTEGWPAYVAPALNCEYSQIGIGSQGWVYPNANGGYPIFGSSWNYYDSADPKTFTTTPNYVVIDEGTNDHGQSLSAITSNVQGVITAMRSTFGSTTKIILVTPYNPTFDDASGNPRLGVIAGYNNYETATPDSNVYLVDLGTSVQQYTLTPLSVDGIHATQASHVIIGKDVLAGIYSDLPSLQLGSVTVNAINTSSANLTATAPTGGLAPYTYQWYRSNISGFTPGSGNVLSGANSLSLNDSGLTPSTTYYYVLQVTDNYGTVSDYSQQAVSTAVNTYAYSGFSGVGAPAASVTPVVPNPATTSTIPVSPAPTNSSNSTSSNAKTLISNDGTYYLITGNEKQGITSPGILASYGYTFSDATQASSAEIAMPTVSNLPPNDGSLVKTKLDPTIYLISNGQRYGFISSRVFITLGYKFSSVLTVTVPELDQLPIANPLTSATQAHLPGTNILLNNTVYLIGLDNMLHAYPSIAVYNSWNIPNDFANVVIANSADQTLPIGSVEDLRK